MTIQYSTDNPRTATLDNGQNVILCDKLSKLELFNMIAQKLSARNVIQDITDELREQLYFISTTTLWDMFFYWDQYDFAAWYRREMVG